MPIEVTPEYLTAAASDCDAVAGNVSDQLGKLLTFATNLAQEWEGTAAFSFDDLMHRWHGSAGRLHEALVNMGDGLRKNAHNYTGGERDSVKNMTGIDDLLPPVNI